MTHQGRAVARPMRAPALHPDAAAGHPGVNAGHPGGNSPRGGSERRLLLAREQIAGEVAALRLAQDAPDTERLRFLADLATRLDALLAWLAVEPAGTAELTGLTELVVKLRACEAPGPPRGAGLDALWDEAIRLLTRFTQPLAGDAGTGGRGEFWKRRR
jgi:hypothetical protein